MILKAGDRVVSTVVTVFGTVVSGGSFGPEHDVPVRWDGVDYNSEYPYSLPTAKHIRKLTKLDRALA